MAEGVVSDIALRLLEVLGSRLYQEIELAFGVKDEIEKLMETVGTIKAVLVDAEEKHSKKNAEVTEWLQRLKDAFYDADDLLDDFATQLKQREAMSGNKITNEVRIFFSESNQIAYSVKMAHKIKAVRSKLEEINNNRKFHLTENLAETRVGSTEREQTHSFVREEMVIGRDDEKYEIIKLLLLEPNDQDENVFVIPIVGMGGLGKTTLAQLVYNDEQVKNHFELRMWVCVSEQFDLKIILEKIINSVTNEKPEGTEIEQLQKSLRAKINNKTYLLVLDDVWNEDLVKWNKLKDLLINGARGSKILVTARSQQVAKITNRDLSYNLQGLNKDKSWLLFIKKAFDKGIVPEDSEQLVEIGKEIVAKCGGLPLVISTIGSLLNSDISENYWSSVRNNEMFEIINNQGGILPILKFSYEQLPSHLKQCFAFCTLFPKDFKIEKQKLISLWMAQGFLESSNRDQSLENVGNKYFMNLRMRSFFQDPEYDEHGNIITCKMHDFMHDLAQLVGGVECTLITTETNDSSIGNRCRHVSIDCEVFGYIGNLLNVLGRAKPIRTLIFLDQSISYHSFTDPHEIFSRYRYLRALDFSAVWLEELSHKISKLKHLRYLNLSVTDIKRLPNSIVELKNLEKLDLSYCERLRELPRNMRKMVNLKDVIIWGCYRIRMPLGLWGSSDRETLAVIMAYERNYRRYKKCGSASCVFNEMVGRQRSHMTLQNLEHDDAKLANYIQKMEFLQLLGQPHDRSETDGRCEKMLEGPNLKDIEISYFDGVKLPRWPYSTTNLTSITVTYCKSCRYIPELDELSSLKSLYLKELDDLEYISDKAISYSSALSTTICPSLSEITLLRCRKLKGWWRIDDDDGATNHKYLPLFACLSTLEISSCPNLTSMPRYPSIDELTLVDTSWKPLRHTMMMVNSVGPSTSSAPLSELKYLKMDSIDDLECPSEDGLQFGSSLGRLEIFNCKNLKALPESIPTLTSLEIENCSNLKALPESMPTLVWSKIRKCPNLKALPESMPNLNSLMIKKCPNLKALPESMPYLTSLQIENCPNLKELPEKESMPELISLKITNCPNLKALPESMPHFN